MSCLNGRLALVTGAAAGLGAGIAQRLAESGYRLALTHREPGTAADEALSHVRAHDADAQSYPADMTRPPTLASLVAALEVERGGIDLLVHAAGPMSIHRVERSDFAQYEDMMTSNLGSAVALALAVLPGMRARGYGRLIFFGMTGSSITRPARGLAYYGAAKAGLVAFARTLALEEAAFGITVNVIEPGDIRQKQISRHEARQISGKNPTGRAGSWEDIADAVRYLASDDAGFVNGAVLAVGGGLIDAQE